MRRTYNFTGPLLLLVAVAVVALGGSLVGSLDTATSAETMALEDLVLAGIAVLLTLTLAAIVSAIRRGPQ